MAKKKVASRAAAQPAVKKKWSGHKTAAKSSARKTIKSKARGASAAKPKAAKRPKQRVAVSHHREEDFKGAAGLHGLLLVRGRCDNAILRRDRLRSQAALAAAQLVPAGGGPLARFLSR